MSNALAKQIIKGIERSERYLTVFPSGVVIWKKVADEGEPKHMKGVVLRVRRGGAMTIRLASMEDLEESYAIVKNATKHMNEQGIFQWDDIYPEKATLRQDIERQEMYVIDQDSRVVGIIVLNEEQSPEYTSIPWKYAGRVLVVHRLTISPAHQSRGLASCLMKFAEDAAATRAYNCIRLDAFTQNPAAITLYDRRGYRKAGIVHFRKGEFFCYEKAFKAESPHPNQQLESGLDM